MNIKINKKYAVFFTVGGTGYALIELLWRGHTHWTMIIAGGVCFVIFSMIAESFSERSIILKSILSSAAVTTVELIFGIIFNIILKMNVWDYSAMPLNFLGQICPLYTFLWAVLGFIFIPLAEKLNRLLE